MRTTNGNKRWCEGGSGLVRLGVFACSIIPLSPIVAQAVLLYDVNFEAPLHTVNAPPTLGQGTAPRDTVTRIAFGDPVIAAQPGVLDGQFLKLLSGDQVILGIGASYWGFLEQYPYYRITADLVIEDLGSTSAFKMFVDSPTAHSVRFESTGRIVATVLGDAAYEQPIGSFDFGGRLGLDVRVYPEIQWWSIRLDDDLVFAGDFPSHYLGGTRMRMLRPAIVGLGTVDLDNVRIEGLPEPAMLTVWTAGLLIVLRRKPACLARTSARVG